MTAVLVFGDIPNTGHVPQSGTERINIGDGEGAVPPDAVIDLVRHRLNTAGYVVAVYPSWRPEPALRALRLAHVGLGTERLILTPCSLPPLALSIVADQLGYLAPYCPPGALVAIMSALEHVTLSGAWTRSVAGLEHIPASLSDHVASYVPGGGFMVTVSPTQRIHRITGSAPLGEIPYQPADPVHVLTASSEGGDTEWLQGHLLPALRAQHVRPLAPPPLAETYWGTRKYVEFVAFSGHPKALSVIANSVRCRPCPWCGEPVGTSTCPLCGMVAPYRPAPPSAPPSHDPALHDHDAEGTPSHGPPRQSPPHQRSSTHDRPTRDGPIQDPPVQDPPAQSPPAQSPPAQGLPDAQEASTGPQQDVAAQPQQPPQQPQQPQQQPPEGQSGGSYPLADIAPPEDPSSTTGTPFRHGEGVPASPNGNGVL